MNVNFLPPTFLANATHLWGDNTYMYTYTVKQKVPGSDMHFLLWHWSFFHQWAKITEYSAWCFFAYYALLCIFDFEAYIYISDILLTVLFFQSKHSFMKNITDICLKYVGVLGLVYIARFVFRRNNSTTPCDRVALSCSHYMRKKSSKSCNQIYSSNIISFFRKKK